MDIATIMYRTALNEIVSRNLKELKTFCTFTRQKKAVRDIPFDAPLYSRGNSPHLTMSIQHAPNERTGIARSSATVKFLYGLAGSGSRQKVTIAYDIKWSERPIYVGIDSFGIGWIAADSSSHQLATKTASAVGEVSYCYASTGNSAGLSSSVDMDTSQSGGVVGTPVIINHQNTSTYGKHISGTVGVGTQSNSSNINIVKNLR